MLRPSSGISLSTPLVLKLAAAAGLSFAVVALAPNTVSATGNVPPVRMLLVTGTLVGLICAGALFWGIRADLKLPTKVAVYAVGFNALVIVVKLVLAPHGYYQVNQMKDLDTPIDNSFAAVLAAGFIFALYFVAYAALYRLFRRRIENFAVVDPPRLARRGADRRVAWGQRRVLGASAADLVPRCGSAGAARRCICARSFVPRARRRRRFRDRRRFALLRCALLSVHGADRAQGLSRPRRRRALRQADAPPPLRQGCDVRGQPDGAARRRRAAPLDASTRARRARPAFPSRDHRDDLAPAEH